MRAANVPLQRRDPTPWSTWIEQLAQRLADQGRELPPKPARGARLEIIVPDHGITEYVKPGHWDVLDNCAWKVVEFWDTLPGRQEPSRTRYARWSVGKPAPSPRNFDVHGGWSAVLTRARELRTKRRIS